MRRKYKKFSRNASSPVDYLDSTALMVDSPPLRVRASTPFWAPSRVRVLVI